MTTEASSEKDTVKIDKQEIGVAELLSMARPNCTTCRGRGTVTLRHGSKTIVDVCACAQNRMRRKAAAAAKAKRETKVTILSRPDTGQAARLHRRLVAAIKAGEPQKAIDKLSRRLDAAEKRERPF